LRKSGGRSQTQDPSGKREGPRSGLNNVPPSRTKSERGCGEEDKRIYNAREVAKKAPKDERDPPPPNSPIWVDIDTFRDLLRSEAELRLRILGEDWVEIVKEESNWRLSLYKEWLWMLHKGIGTPLVSSRSDRAQGAQSDSFRGKRRDDSVGTERRPRPRTEQDTTRKQSLDETDGNVSSGKFETRTSTSKRVMGDNIHNTSTGKREAKQEIRRAERVESTVVENDTRRRSNRRQHRGNGNEEVPQNRRLGSSRDGMEQQSRGRRRVTGGDEDEWARILSQENRNKVRSLLYRSDGMVSTIEAAGSLALRP
jgi:hypothetical protein